MCLFVQPTLFLKCGWQEKSVFYLSNWVQPPWPCPGLDGWTSCKQLLSCPTGKWRKGIISGPEKKGKPVLDPSEVSGSSPLVPQETIHYRHTADLHLRFVGFLLQFQSTSLGSRRSTVSLQIWLYSNYTGTKCYNIQAPRWLQGNCNPSHSAWPSEEDATVMGWDWPNTHAGTHVRVLPKGVWIVSTACFGAANWV